MSKPGTVLFSAKDGYDEDMWDDSALIQQYDRALQSSRSVQLQAIQFFLIILLNQGLIYML